MKVLDGSTAASLPGELLVSRRRYARYVGTGAADRWFRLFCTCLPWAARDLPWLGARVRHWTQTQEHLLHGCLNPAVVLDSARGLVAVFTSLTAQGDRPTPVLKIVRERLDMVPPERSTNGFRLAAASIYFRTPESWAQGRWSDFSPIVVDCLVDDTALCEEAVGRLEPSDWRGLEAALQGVDDLGAEGLFHVDVPEEILRDDR